MRLINCEITAFFLDAWCSWSWLLLPWCLANLEVLVWVFKFSRCFCHFSSFLNLFYYFFLILDFRSYIFFFINFFMYNSIGQKQVIYLLCSKSDLNEAGFDKVHSNVKRGDIVGITGFPGLWCYILSEFLLFCLTLSFFHIKSVILWHNNK